MKLSYAWRQESLFPNADPDEVGNRLSELEAEYGSLTKEILLKEASSTRSPLYPLIERDAQVALERIQKHQVTSIISQLVVVKNGKKTKQRAFVYVEPTKYQRKAFVSLVVAMRTPTLREQVVDRGVHELDRWFERYASLAEFRPIKRDLLRIREKIQAELMSAI